MQLLFIISLCVYNAISHNVVTQWKQKFHSQKDLQSDFSQQMWIWGKPHK